MSAILMRRCITPTGEETPFTSRHWPNAAKIVVVFIFTVLWLLVDLVRAQPGPPEIKLDDSIFMANAALFQQDAVSGRDFHFTYGPLYQLFLYSATHLTATHSPFDSYPWMLFMCHAASAVLISIIVLLIDQLDWRDAMLLYLSLAFLDLFSDVQGFRIAITLLMAVLAYRSLTASRARFQLFWAALTGIACLMGQLVSAELAVYAAISLVLIFVLFGTWQFGAKTALTLLSIPLGVLLGGNIAISMAYKSSSSSYGSFLDYQRYAYDIMRSYQVAAGLQWPFSGSRTIGLFVIPAFTCLCFAVVCRRHSLKAGTLLACLLAVSLVSVKTSFVRSDGIHVLNGLTPFTFTFLILGTRRLFNVHHVTFRGMRTRGIRFAMLCFLWMVWPRHGLAAVYDVWRIADGEVPIVRTVKSLISRKTAAAQILPASLINASYDPSSPMLNFPYQNYIAIALQRPLLTPVLQSYAAGTERLQRFYVSQLEAQRPHGLDITYALDGTSASWAVDGVHAITRAPIIFEYLLAAFELRSAERDVSNIYLLKPRPINRKLVFEDLPFHLKTTGRNTGEITLRSPTSCGLLRLDLQMTYSPMTLLGKVVGIALNFDEQVARHPVVIVPIEMEHPFHVYLSLIEASSFYQVFNDAPIATTAWSRFSFAPWKSDWLGVDPSGVEILKIQCVEPQLFTQ